MPEPVDTVVVPLAVAVLDEMTADPAVAAPPTPVAELEVPPVPLDFVPQATALADNERSAIGSFFQTIVIISTSLQDAPARTNLDGILGHMGAGIAVLLFFFVFLFALVLLPLIVHVWALIDVSQTRDDLFGPPWDNTKQDWTLGLAVAFMVPFGHIVAPILWWTQVRGPKLRGERPQRPFWSGPPKPMPPAMGPSYPGYGPQQSASPAQQPAYGPQQGGPGQPPQRPPWT